MLQYAQQNPITHEGVDTMKFTFIEKKMPASDTLREYTERKIGKLDRFFRKNDTEAFVTFSTERGDVYKRQPFVIATVAPSI